MDAKDNLPLEWENMDTDEKREWLLGESRALVSDLIREEIGFRRSERKQLDDPERVAVALNLMEGD